MKLTWFGGTALRVYIGGQIVVVDADIAPDSVDRGELLAGADRIVVGEELPSIDVSSWRPKGVPRLMEDVPAAEVFRAAEDVVLIAVAGEPVLMLIGGGDLPRFGRWADGAVIVLTASRSGQADEVEGMLRVSRPRLIALAMEESEVDRVVDGLAPVLDGVGLVSLEPGLALEV